MAMKIGGEYNPRYVALRHFLRMGEAAGLSERLVRAEIRKVSEASLRALPDALDEIAKRVKLGDFIEKQFIREGKYDGAYHKGVKVILCEDGELVRLTYGIANPAKKAEGKKPKFTRAQLLKMLEEMPEDEEG